LYDRQVCNGRESLKIIQSEECTVIALSVSTAQILGYAIDLLPECAIVVDPFHK